MSFGGSGGSGNIHTDGDVALNTLADGQVLTYNAGVAKWQNSAPTGGASLSSTAAVALGSASAGSSTSASRQDHVHPTTGLMLSSQQTALKAVCIYNGSAYPTRPSGYGSVEFIGPVDPGSSALTNDTWVNTA